MCELEGEGRGGVKRGLPQEPFPGPPRLRVGVGFVSRVFGLLPLPSADMLRAGVLCLSVKAAFYLSVSKRFQEPKPFRKAAQGVTELVPQAWHG